MPETKIKDTTKTVDAPAALPIKNKPSEDTRDAAKARYHDWRKTVSGK